MSQLAALINITDKTLISQTATQVSVELSGEVIILNLNDGNYYGLDEVGTRVWSLIQEPKTVIQLRDLLMSEYDVEPEQCERELKALLGELADKELVNLQYDAVNRTPAPAFE